MTREQELALLTELGAAFMSYHDCALMLQIDVEQFIIDVLDENTDTHKAYQTGRIQAIFDTNKAILKSAADGSPASQLAALELLKKTTMQNVQ